MSDFESLPCKFDTPTSSTKQSTTTADDSVIRHDFNGVLLELIKKINIKTALFIFIIGIFLFSDIFIEHILSSIPDATDGIETTTKGTIIQLTILSIAYIIFDMLIQCNIL